MSTLREASVDFPAQYLSVSNIVSYASVAAALLAMICASEGRWSVSGMYLGLSVIADMLDGTFANLFSRSERERAFDPAHPDDLSTVNIPPSLLAPVEKPAGS